MRDEYKTGGGMRDDNFGSMQESDLFSRRVGFGILLKATAGCGSMNTSYRLRMAANCNSNQAGKG